HAAAAVRAAAAPAIAASSGGGPPLGGPVSPGPARPSPAVVRWISVTVRAPPKNSMAARMIAPTSMNRFRVHIRVVFPSGVPPDGWASGGPWVVAGGGTDNLDLGGPVSRDSGAGGSAPGSVPVWAAALDCWRSLPSRRA